MRKKIMVGLIALLACMPGVLADNIKSCKSVLPNVIIDEKIPNAVSTVVLVIKIAVPVLLVVFGMIDLMKSIVASKEDEIKKGRQIFVKRLIAGVLVFFIFSIVQLLISFVADENKEGIMDCANCFINGDCKKTNALLDIIDKLKP